VQRRRAAKAGDGDPSVGGGSRRGAGGCGGCGGGRLVVVVVVVIGDDGVTRDDVEDLRVTRGGWVDGWSGWRE